MAEEIKFEKEFLAGITYRAESDKYYIVKAVGTDSTLEPSYLEIDGKRCLEIYSKIAPLKQTSSNLLGMFELGNLDLVIPPNKAFIFYGSPGSKIRMKGILGTLAPGEVLPNTPSQLLLRLMQELQKQLLIGLVQLEKNMFLTDT
jgi:hypothetical protein